MPTNHVHGRDRGADWPPLQTICWDRLRNGSTRPVWLGAGHCGQTADGYVEQTLPDGEVRPWIVAVRTQRVLVALDQQAVADFGGVGRPGRIHVLVAEAYRPVRVRAVVIV